MASDNPPRENGLQNTFWWQQGGILEAKLYSKINGVYEIYGWPSGVKFKEGIYNGKGIDLNLLAPGMYIYRVGQSSFYFLKM